MGKKQHQSDKLYLTCTEWSTFYGGKKARDGEQRQYFKRLPYNCCSLTFQPYEAPYCTKEGVIFDLRNIVPFIKKYGVNPVSGEKISGKDLIKLIFHKNSEGKDHCPITYKVFTESSHIVAVGTTGNVYSWDAIEKLNIRPSNWTDLVDGTPFVRKDIITIQDPTQLQKFDISQFFHVQRNMKLEDDGKRQVVRSANQETRDTLTQLQKDYKPGSLAALGAATSGEKLVKRAADSRLNAAIYSTGAVAASLTSTSVEPSLRLEPARIEDDVIRYRRIKKKGYVRFVTTHGHLNLELYCEMCPKTCENFLRHCRSGYYTDTVFHRSVRNFVLQGGDPTGTGHGGDSSWGGVFKDEVKLPSLMHEGRGVLSMANSGKDTNKSQFFITYRSAKHLNGKHTVFGKLVGGMETLDVIEKIEVDKKDRPIEEVRILNVQIFADPFTEVDEQLATERAAEEQEKKDAAHATSVTSAASAPKSDKLKVYRPGGVGKFINMSATKRSIHETVTSEDDQFISADTTQPIKKKRATKSDLTDFSSW